MQRKTLEQNSYLGSDYDGGQHNTDRENYGMG